MPTSPSWVNPGGGERPQALPPTSPSVGILPSEVYTAWQYISICIQWIFFTIAMLLVLGLVRTVCTTFCGFPFRGVWEVVVKFVGWSTGIVAVPVASLAVGEARQWGALATNVFMPPKHPWPSSLGNTLAYSRGQRMVLGGGTAAGTEAVITGYVRTISKYIARLGTVGAVAQRGLDFEPVFLTAAEVAAALAQPHEAPMKTLPTALDHLPTIDGDGVDTDAMTELSKCLMATIPPGARGHSGC